MGAKSCYGNEDCINFVAPYCSLCLSIQGLALQRFRLADPRPFLKSIDSLWSLDILSSRN